MRKLVWKVALAMSVLVLGSLALPAQDADFESRSDGPWLESVPLDAAEEDAGFDFAQDFVWVLHCPPGCVKVRVVNHHGEVNEFCDCNGDGRPDETCQIWLKTWRDGTQKPICHAGCPGEGQPGGQQCAMMTEELPSGPVTKWCECR